jgi:hypothetical protein
MASLWVKIWTRDILNTKQECWLPNHNIQFLYYTYWVMLTLIIFTIKIAVLKLSELIMIEIRHCVFSWTAVKIKKN